MGDVVFPRPIGSVKLLTLQFSLGHQLRHPQEFPLGVAFILILQPPDSLAIRADVGVKPQVIDAVLKRKYLRFAVQGQPQSVNIFPDHLQAMLQVFLAGVDQIKIVHIPAVKLDPQLVLDQLVHAV